MKRLLLGSRIGLRVFGMFALAAGAPLVLLAALSQDAIDANLRRSESASLALNAKTTGMQTLERLRAAKQALIAAAGNDPGGTSVAARSEPLLAVAASANAGPGRDRLLVRRHGDTAAPELVIETTLASGERRAGLVNPAYLWEGADEWPQGTWLCALDAEAQPLFCSEPAAAALAASLAKSTPDGSRTQHAAWKLFFGTDFAAPDWYFIAGTHPHRDDLLTEPSRRMLPTAGAAAVLLAVLLSLVQIRRTLTPLNRLVTGARELAHRRTASRLDIRSHDEFGELAGAFNEMASRLGARFDEVESLAAIDGDIVGQRPLPDILSRIAMRLAQLRPRGWVMLACTIAAPGKAQAHLVMPGGREPTLIEIAPHELERLAGTPEEAGFDASAELPASFAAVLGPAAGRGLKFPLIWGDDCFGFIAVGVGDASPMDDDGRRQILELKNRAAIAASAAERDRHLRWEARHDRLTGLLNRSGIDEALAQAIRRAGPGEQACAVLFIDLDRFKAINDGLGHAAGDVALVRIAERLRGHLPAQAFIGRQAGDEFIVIPGGAFDREAIAQLAQRLCDLLAQPMSLEDRLFEVGASIGVSLCDDPHSTPEALLRSADHAMYEAKRLGGGRHRWFDHQVDAKAERRACIERELPLAAQRGELKLLYQPRIDRRSGDINSVEALLRWQHPRLGACSPAEFIPIAERSELIERLGQWVIDAACAQAAAWAAQGIAALPIAINLSARQIASDQLLHDLQAAFDRHGVPAHAIELEITEGLFVEQTESTITRLHALRAMGLIVALDDFGTGYSSMAYLRRLPIDIIKIDRAFVTDLGAVPAALAVAQAIVSLATSLGMRTVAEGVETPQQLRVLSRIGCDEFQGYLFSRPVDAQAIPALRLASRARRELLAGDRECGESDEDAPQAFFSQALHQPLAATSLP